MITPSKIVDHLAKYLPMVTDLFSVNLAVSSAIISAGYTITVNTTAAHGLTTGHPLLLNSGKTPNTIASVVEETAGETALITFNDVHDFTTPNEEIETETLTAVGFNESVWNTDLAIIEVPTDLTVVVNFPPGASGVPTFTAGNAIGYEQRPLSIFGIHSITVTGTTQFTVTLDNTNVPSLPAGNILDLKATVRARIAAADNVARADAIYTKQASSNDLWAFVIMTDTTISKDRNTLNDGTASFSHQDEMRLRNLQSFSIVVYFRTADKISGATAQDLAYGDLYTNLLGVLYGFSGFATDSDGSEFVTVANGNGAGETRQSAYYTHVYDWQLPVDITFENGFALYEDVAFRRIESTFGMFTADNDEKLTLAFDLDP